MTNDNVTELDVLVVGAGFGGVYGVYRYRNQGLSVKCVEAASGVGGVWYHNRYPGARCDVRSIDYCYSFATELYDEWRWTETYAAQPEIERYINYVTDRFDLRKDIIFDTRVTTAHWDEKAKRWDVGTNTGAKFRCRFLVLCTGNLSSPKVADFPGLSDFKGEWYQTSKWPLEPVKFEGKRVGVIGTGSSGVQAIPEIAKAAGHLDVFVRSPNFSFPARNGPVDEEEYAKIRARYPEYREELRYSYSQGTFAILGKSYTEFANDEERRASFDERWEMGGLTPGGTFLENLTDIEVNKVTTALTHEKIKGIVKDPVVAEKLCPKDHPLGTRRTCLDTNYYETFNRDNVRLVDLRDTPIETVTPTGIKTSAAEYPLDMIVFATGFDAFTGPISAMDIRNAKGEHVMDKWKDGPKTYLGMMVNGFPNLFIVTGPGSPSVLSNCIMAAEVDVDWAGDAITWLDENGLQTIEAEAEAQEEWAKHVAEVAMKTLYPLANSWYMGANIPGKPRVFLPYIGGLGNFIKITRGKAAAGYEGFMTA